MEFDLPENAVVGSTPERKAAWDALSEEGRKEIFKQVAPYLADALKEAMKSRDISDRRSNIIPPSQLDFVGWDGMPQRIPTSPLAQDIKELFENSNQGTANSLNGWNKESDPGTLLRGGFYDSLADLFTPYYHVSYGEPDQFATFQNNHVQLIVDQLKGRTPFSYYRVHPMGFLTQNGTKYGFYKIDYLTLWNHDSGLAINPWSYINMWLDFFWYYDPPLAYAILAIIDGVDRGHDFDTERSAVLVGAPVVSNDYNPNPNAYYVYSAYAAAHEGTDADHSTYSSPASPIQGHVELFLALSKHGTYFGNPNGLPLAPGWLIDTCYLTAQNLYLQGLISFSTYSTLAYYFDLTFFNAITERFISGGYSGFTDSNRRINVGEPITNPYQILNGAGFIMTNGELGVRPKLMTPIWLGLTKYSICFAHPYTEYDFYYQCKDEHVYQTA